jgi:NAD(P)-dependent dehydrogenase (short-subunit alcohol dehydrogenase family)
MVRAGTLYPSLNERTVFVTGGASGIGAAFVRAFHAQGCQVAFVDMVANLGAALAINLDPAAPHLVDEAWVRPQVT